MHERPAGIIVCGGHLLDSTFLDALYGGHKVTACQRSELLAGADPAAFGLNDYDLWWLTCGRLGRRGASQSPAPTGGGFARSSRLTKVPVSTDSVQLVVANPQRVGLIVKNDGDAVLLVALAPTADVDAYTLDLVPGAVCPDIAGWQGPVSAVTAAGTTVARLTELTP